MIRESIKAAQVAAMKSGDKARLGAVRLMLAKLKDRDIELRTASQQGGLRKSCSPISVIRRRPRGCTSRRFAFPSRCRILFGELR